MFQFLRFRSQNRLLSVALLLVTGLLSLTQQCSDVRLHSPIYESDFASRGFPYRLYPPTDYEQHRRFVIMVDMSRSMLSGPCPFDVGVAPWFHTNSPYRAFDPNKDTGADVNDGRGAARGCYVDPSLPIAAGAQRVPSPYQFGQQYGTFIGSDYEGYRLEILTKWIAQLRQGLTARAQRNTRVMVIPVTGGSAQLLLDQRDPIKRKFIRIDDPALDQAVQMMRTENQRNHDLLLDQAAEGRWLQMTMGTTAPGQVFNDVFTQVSADMKSLSELGVLSETSYKILYMGDGLVNPTKQDGADVLKIHPLCGVGQTTGFCSSLTASMKRSWGDANLNSDSALDLKISLIQALPKFYGAGLVEVDFLQLQRERIELSYPSQSSAFVRLKEMAKARHSRIGLWQVRDGVPPFDLAPAAGDVRFFKMSHMVILNPNVRLDLNGVTQVDSDGDGLFDADEARLNLNPHHTRSNGYCLDSLIARQAFSSRCQSFASGSACDPQLDSDGDGLNQCDEMVLGTDPFDFDTDGDAIPDFLEWIYGFNILESDRDQDTNGDAIPNVVNFAAGLGPKLYYEQIPEGQRASYAIDFLGNERLPDAELGEVLVENYRVELKNILAAPLPVLPPDIRDVLYLSRLGRNFNNLATVKIPERHQLLNASIRTISNRIVVLVRLVDENQPQVVNWRILKFNMSEASNGRGVQLDLSTLEQMRVMDLHYEVEE